MSMTFSKKTFSVISSSRRSGAIWLWASAWTTRSWKFFSCSCNGETFTDTLMSGDQVEATWHASLKTQPPIGTTRPVSSRVGTNSPGATIPRTGLSQRSNASKLTILRFRRS